MKTEREPLLDAILDDGDGFREALLSKTLRQVRRKNHLRQYKRAGAIFVLLAILPFLFRNSPKTNPLPEVANVHRPYQLVHTQPVRESLVVRSQPNRFSVSPLASFHLVTVTSASSKEFFQSINDEQLFSLLAGHPAALVWHNSTQPELLFLNIEDQNRLVP
jgi:hypothetical protein